MRWTWKQIKCVQKLIYHPGTHTKRHTHFSIVQYSTILTEPPPPPSEDSPGECVIRVSSCPLLLSPDILLWLDVWREWHFDKMNFPQASLREDALMSQSVGLSQQQTGVGLHQRGRENCHCCGFFDTVVWWWWCSKGSCVNCWCQQFLTTKAKNHRKVIILISNVHRKTKVTVCHHQNSPRSYMPCRQDEDITVFFFFLLYWKEQISSVCLLFDSHHRNIRIIWIHSVCCLQMQGEHAWHGFLLCALG